ncbi:flagellar biosynthetic protein FliO [Paenibacillus sp. BK033]|uniref:flagellar biosynthetic protein FliO n=1 Tax=Paenibacillus sp. BK033 TaxID=2512133 RepID=UPI0014046FCD|nr:flagellar biosynthetic protein FliO [Paenibacillus sp. BK033]NIK68840.1 flagellar protein FliO/FliZ [Paenibacillus sp. BK720]
MTAVGVAVQPAFAAAAGSGNDESPMAGSYTGSVIWVIVSLFIVIGLIVLLIKFLSQRNRMWGTNRAVRSLGGVALGQNNSLQVVELSGRLYVVGVGENVTLLDKIDDEKQVQAILASLGRQSNTAGWSANTISDFLKRFRKEESQAGEDLTEVQWNMPESSFESLLNHNLSKQADRKQQLESLLKESKHDGDDNEK